MSLERIRADDRGALQQRVEHDLLGVLLRPLDPKVREVRVLLALRSRRADGETARGHAVELALGDAAEVARALKNQELVEVVGRVDWSPQPETGVTREVARGDGGRADAS